MTSSASASGPAPDQGARRVVFVMGSDRRATSALACSLQTLGLHVPRPEVPPDETNPQGFGESQWVVDFHERLLRKAKVVVADARPAAWFDTGKVSTHDKLREEALSWLDDQFSEEVREVVLKDAGLAWFIGLWRSAALRSGIDASYAITLRAPTEIVGGRQTHRSEVSRAGGWINQMLHVERTTRGSRRAFVRHADLLDDWTIPVYRLGSRLGLDAVRNASGQDMRRVHQLISPEQQRERATGGDVPLPAPLRAIAEATWEQLNTLCDGPEEESEEVHAALDEIRLAYYSLYTEAEALTESSLLAARRKRRPDRSADESATPVTDEGGASSLSSRARGLLGRRTDSPS